MTSLLIICVRTALRTKRRVRFDTPSRSPHHSKPLPHHHHRPLSPQQQQQQQQQQPQPQPRCACRHHADPPERDHGGRPPGSPGDLSRDGHGLHPDVLRQRRCQRGRRRLHPRASLLLRSERQQAHAHRRSRVVAQLPQPRRHRHGTLVLEHDGASAVAGACDFTPQLRALDARAYAPHPPPPSARCPPPRTLALAHSASRVGPRPLAPRPHPLSSS